MYTGDEVTETHTYKSAPVVTITTTISTPRTTYYYGATVTETLPVSAFEYAYATSTEIIENDCTSAFYTATASATTTQSAKCRPANFATNSRLSETKSVSKLGIYGRASILRTRMPQPAVKRVSRTIVRGYGLLLSHRLLFVPWLGMRQVNTGCFRLP